MLHTLAVAAVYGLLGIGLLVVGFFVFCAIGVWLDLKREKRAATWED